MYSANTSTYTLQMNFLTNSNILLLLCYYYPFFLKYTIILFSLYLFIIHCSFTFH